MAPALTLSYTPIKLAGREGIEPVTFSFGDCDATTNTNDLLKLAQTVGVEPTTNGFEDRRSSY
jgi:hypothetical protein